MSFSGADTLTIALLPAVLEAARIELDHFASGVRIEQKPDKSPVTAADVEAEAVILAALAQILPGVPVIAEEAVAAGRVPKTPGRFLLVDALDGTNLFIRGKPEFSVNIALVEGARPVFGLVYGPASGDLYVTRSDGGSHKANVIPRRKDTDLARLHWTPLRTRAPDPGNLVAFNSRSAGGVATAFLDELKVREARPFGSSLKFCLIAQGDGDVYARFGPTYEWDTAAGQAILEAAGGTVAMLDGTPLTYGKAPSGYLNPHFVAWGGHPLITRDPGGHPGPGAAHMAEKGQ